MDKNSHRVCEIMKRHQLAKKLPPSSVIPLNNKWKVRYLNMLGTHYVIETLLVRCDCKIISHDCQVCPHAYTCTCLDAYSTCYYIHMYYINVYVNIYIYIVHMTMLSVKTEHQQMLIIHILIMYSLLKIKIKIFRDSKMHILEMVIRNVAH